MNIEKKLTAIERMNLATTPEDVLDVYETAIRDVGAQYLAVIFLPRGGERIEDASLAWKVPASWKEHYSKENFFQRDPAVRHSCRTLLPFEWESAPCDRETEREWAEVMHRGRDFGVQKGLVVPVPSLSGNIGAVWVGGPNFDERKAHTPYLHSLGLHLFHRLEKLAAPRFDRKSTLTKREREILAWVSEGKTAWEIGCILNISQRTVEWHVDRVCKRLGAANRLQAVAILGSRSAVDLEHDDAPRRN